MTNAIEIRPNVPPGRATFIVGHEMMHLWLFINGIVPPNTHLKEAVCNAMGVLVYLSMYRRYRLEGGIAFKGFGEDIDFCYNQVQFELGKIGSGNRMPMIRDFIADFIMYTPEPLVRSVIASMYNVLTGCRDV
jgi:hypothetical protein